MNIAGPSSATSAVLATTTNEEASVAVLKKALQADSQSTLALIAAIPQPPNLPANLGRNINTVA